LTSDFSDSGEVDGLITVVGARLAELGVTDRTDAGLTQIRKAVTDLNADRGALNVTLAEFRGTVGYQFTNCPDVYAASENPEHRSEKPSPRFIANNPMKRAVLVRAKFAGLVQACTQVDADIEKQKDLYAGGLVRQLRSHVKDLDAELLSYELARRDAQQEIDEKVNNFSLAAAKAATKESASAAESVKKGAKSVLGFLGTVGKDNDVAAAHVVAEEKLKSLDAVLAAIAGTPSDTQVALTRHDQVAVAVVGDLPALADEAAKLFSEAAKPRLIPFLAAMDYQKLVLKGFEDAREAKREQRAAAAEQMQAVIDETAALARVLQPLTKDPAWAKRSISDLEQSLKSDAKVRLHRALAVYADEVQQHRIDAAVWLVRERSAQYEEGLAQSKVIAAQWEGLMDTQAKVLADYHAAGIKRSDLAEFFKALGLVSIGVGVAQ
jgi:hypothetical protein